MASSFARSVGPRGDVNELEYIAALQQTCFRSTRSSGTISSIDVQRYLRSRFGLDITTEQAFDIVLGLGGGRLPQRVRESLAQTKEWNGTPPSQQQQQQHQSMMLSQSIQSSQHRHNRDSVASCSSVMSRSYTKNPRGSATTNEDNNNDDDDEGLDHDQERYHDGGVGGDEEETNTKHGSIESSTNEAGIQISSVDGEDATTSATPQQGRRTRKKNEKETKRLEKEWKQYQELLEEMKRPKMEYLDIVQMVGILFIPTIARYAKIWREENVTKDDDANNNIDSYVMETSFIKEQMLSLSSLRSETANDKVDGETAGKESGGANMGTDSAADADRSIEGFRAESTSDETGHLGPGKQLQQSVLLLRREDHDETSLDPQPPGLLQFILRKLWKSAREQQQAALGQSGSSFVSSSSLFWHQQEPPMVTPELVESFMISCGAHEHARDKALIQRMVNVAQSPSGRLDDIAFINALTSDISAWQVGHEDRECTYVFDVFGHSDLQTFDRMDGGKIVQQTPEQPGRKNDNTTTNEEDPVSDNAANVVVEGGHEISDTNDAYQLDPSCAAIVEDGDKDDHEQNDDGKNHQTGLSDVAESDGPKGSEKGDSDIVSDVVESNEVKEATKEMDFVPDIVDSDGEKEAHNEMGVPSDVADDGAKEAATDMLALSAVKELKGLNLHAVEDTEERARVAHLQDVVKLQRYTSGKVIDFVVDSYGSFTLLIMIWLVYLCNAAAYLLLVLSTPAFAVTCGDGLSLQEKSFGCTLAETVVSWMTVAILLVGFGMVVFIPLSIGNHPTYRGPWRQVAGSFIAAFETSLPSLIVFNKDIISDPPTTTVEVINSKKFQILHYTSLAAGGVLTLAYFVYFLTLRKGKDEFLKNREVASLVQSADERGTAIVKRAATRKINRMLQNARRMHDSVDSSDAMNEHDLTVSKRLDLTSQSDPVFQTYVLYGEEKEECCSWTWVFRRLLSKDLFEVDGIWIPSRVWTFQVLQIVVLILFAIIIEIIIENAMEQADAATAELPEGLPGWIYDLVPTAYEVRIACFPSFVIALVVCVMIILLYIPSTVSTILKFRSGVYNSLGSVDFQIYRVAADTAYMNTANAVYGMAGAGFLFFIIFSLLIFLFIWEFSRNIMLTLLAWGIGLTITILLKTLMTTFCRKRYFRAFYRVRPGKMNLSSLALECWYIGLGGGVLVGRITQFLLAAAFWIGRIDEPFLAPNVGLLGYRFDYVPLNFKKEILVHEAHRHPFIERIGAMYLMRLRHKGFGADAGACWRQIFVVTLMPWLMKYRVRLERRCVDSLKDQTSEKEIEFEENQQIADVLAQNITGTGLGMLDAGQEGVNLVGEVGKALVVDAPTRVVQKAKSVYWN